ncbi:MAG: amidohydrolase [Burkholderiaceae bacterium]
MKAEKAQWLAKTVETAIDPSQPIVDAHHHLWDRSGSKYLFDDLQADAAAGHRVVATVFVECLSRYDEQQPAHLKPVGETAFVAEQAAASRQTGGAVVMAIVPFADLTLGAALEEVLDAHEAAGQGLFRGVRHPTSNDQELGDGHIPTPPGLMNTAEFRQGVAALGRRGLSLDAWMFHHQLDELVALARDHPDVTIVLNHIGGPLGVRRFANRRTEVRAAWQEPMKLIARCPNVVLKVGGIGMNRYYGGGWPELPAAPGSAELFAYWGDDLKWCIDLFGPNRCLFESNFPVDRESCSYTVLWNVYQRVAQNYSPDERDQLFYETAVRIYKLDLPASAHALRS